MNYERTRKALMAALDCPSVENRLTATIALEDHSETLQLRIDELEAALHKLATAPWVPQRVVDMAREALAMDGDEYIAHLDKAREWPMATNE